MTHPSVLGNLFWRDWSATIRTIDSLRLAPEVAVGWKHARIRKPRGLNEDMHYPHEPSVLDTVVDLVDIVMTFLAWAVPI